MYLSIYLSISQNKIMKPIQKLNAFLQRVFVEIHPEVDEGHRIALLEALKRSPSLLGDEVLVEEPFPTDRLTDAQRQLLKQPFFSNDSDAADHLFSYSDEECRLVETAGNALSAMNATDVRDETRVREACPGLNIVEYRKIQNAAWDPKKRDTVVQLKFELSHPAPLRLVMAPFSTVFPSLALMVRHVGKPFQAAHMTVTDPEIVRDHLRTCFYFIATFWVGPYDHVKVEIGTAYRSAHFPGIGSAPDYVCRILTRSDLHGDELQEAYDDFNEAYGDEEGEEFHSVPVLLQKEDFIRLGM